MSGPMHVIGKCVFELQAESKESAERAFDALSRLSETRLPALLQTLFDAALPNPDVNLRLDRLEIDLGELDFADLENQLLHAIEKKWQEVQPDLKLPEPEKTGNTQDRLLEWLLFFLEHGRYPWWADQTENTPSPDQLLKEVLADPGLAAGPWLAPLAGNSSALRRLSEYLDETALQQWISKLSASHPPEWRQAWNEIREALGRVPQSHNWLQWWRQASLSSLVSAQASGTELPPLKIIIETVFVPLAASRLSSTTTAVYRHLQSIISPEISLVQEAAYEVIGAEGPQTPAQQAQSLEERIAFFLKYGYLLLQHPNEGLEPLFEAFRTSLRQASPAFEQWIRELLANPGYRRRFQEQFPLPLLADTVALLARDRLKPLIVYSTAFTGRIPRNGADGRPEASDPLWPVLLEFIIRYAPSPGEVVWEAWLEHLLRYPAHFTLSGDILEATLLLTHPGRSGEIAGLIRTLRQTIVNLHPDLGGNETLERAILQQVLSSEGAPYEEQVFVQKMLEKIVQALEWPETQHAQVQEAWTKTWSTKHGRAEENFMLTEPSRVVNQAETPSAAPAPIWYFLEFGRFPQGQAIDLPALERELSTLLREQPQTLLAELYALQARAEVAARVARQFSEAVVSDLLQHLYAAQGISADSLEALITTAQALFPQTLNKQEWREHLLRTALISRGSVISGSSWLPPNLAAKAAQAESVVLQKLIAALAEGNSVRVALQKTINETEIPSAAPAPLWYFLEFGRFPQGQQFDLPTLERELSTLLREQAQTLLAELYALQARAEVAARVARQFSEAVVLDLLQHLYAAQGISADALESLITTAQTLFPKTLNTKEWREHLLRTALLSRGSAISGSTWLPPDLAAKAAQAESVVLQKLIAALAEENPVRVALGKAASESEIPSIAPAPLWYFLEFGRFPQGQAIDLPALERELSTLLREQTQSLLAELYALQARAEVAARVARQFSEAVVSDLLQHLYAAQGISADSLEALITTAQALFPQTLNTQEWREHLLRTALLSRGSAISGSTWLPPDLAAKAAQSESVVIQTLIAALAEGNPVRAALGKAASETENPSAAPAPLWYFLEFGRFPQGQQFDLPALETELSTLLREQAQTLLAELYALQARVEVAARVARQFSEAVVSDLLQLLYAAQGISADALESLITTAQTLFPKTLNTKEWREHLLRTALLSRGSAISGSTWLPPNLAAKAAQSESVVLQNLIAALAEENPVRAALQKTINETEIPSTAPAPLWYFLEFGRFPQGQAIDLPALETELSTLLREQPQTLFAELYALQSRAEVAARVARQFSEAVVSDLLQLLYAAQGISADALESLITTAQTLFPKTLNTKEWREHLLRTALLSRGSAISGSSWLPPDLAEKAAQSESVVLQNLIAALAEENPVRAALQKTINETETPSAAPLWYFLEFGRFPQGQQFDLPALERELSTLLREQAQTLLAELYALQARAEVAARVARQFSEAVVSDLLQHLYAAQGIPADALESLITTAQTLFPQTLNTQEWREHLLRTALISRGSAISGSTWLPPDLAVKAAQSESVVLQKLIAALAEENPVRAALGKAATPSTAPAPLWYFLEFGRFPQGQAIDLPALERELTTLLREQAQSLLAELYALQSRAEVAARLARQFSEAVISDLLQHLYAAQGISADALESLITTAQTLFPQTLNTQEWREHLLRTALISRGSVISGSSWLPPDLAAKAAQAESVVLQNLIAALAEENPVRAALGKAASETEIPSAAPAPLWYFLEFGRFPQGQAIDLPALERELSTLLREQAQTLLTELYALQARVEVAARVARQFSEAVVSDLLQHLYAAQGISADSLEALITTAQALFPQTLNTQEWREHLLRTALISRGSVISGSSWLPPDLAEKAAQAESVVLQNLIAALAEENPVRVALGKAASETETPSAAPAPLWYFLEFGRFPQGRRQEIATLEKELLELLSTQPGEIRSRFMTLQPRANLAGRLSDMFSRETLRAIISTLFGAQSSVPTLVLAFERTLTAHFPGEKTGANSLYAALYYLLQHLSGSVDPLALLKNLLQSAHSFLDRSVLEILETEWQKPGFDPVLRNYLRELQELPGGAEQDSIREILLDWEPDTESLKMTADRLQYRLQQSESAWWDDPTQTNLQLLQTLTRLPAPQAFEALRPFLRPVLAERWLPRLEPGEFVALTRHALGDYSPLLQRMEELLERSIAAELTPPAKAAYRAEVLHQVLSAPALDSEFIVRSVLKALSNAGGTRPIEGIERLLPMLNPGDLYGQRLLSVLQLIHSELSAGEMPPSSSPGLPPEETPSPQVRSAAERAESELRAIRQFLYSGVLPPEFQDMQHPARLEQLIYRAADQYPELLKLVLRQTLREHQARARINTLFSERLRLTLSSLLLGAAIDDMAATKNDLFALLPSLDREVLQSHFTPFLIEKALEISESGYQRARFVALLVEYLAEALQFQEKQLWALLQAQAGHPDAVLGELRQLLPGLLAEQLQSEQKPARAREMENIPEEGLTLEPDESILVQNAGLVIVAPFLPRLFDNLGLLEKRQFIDEQAAEKAVHVLQFLATGLSETPEHQLVLNKILCGIPLDTPIPLGIELSDSEKAQCESMLHGVLQNWEKMQSSSIRNLRGAFLIRDGLLREQESRWMLQMERKAYDIVLDYLPWTISLIKLPWMPKRMDTIWTKPT